MPSVSTSVAPRKMDIVARVTIMGWSLKRAMNTPLNRPPIAPMAIAASTARITGPPEETIRAATAPEKASTEPMEMSMPPSRIAKQTPAARMP